MFAEETTILTNGSSYRAVARYSGTTLAESEQLDDVLATAASRGLAVTFGPGDFLLHAPLRLRTGDRVSGAGPGVTKLRLAASEAAEAVVACADVHDATITELTVSGGENSAADTGISIRSSVGVAVRGVTVVGFSRYGVRLADNSRFCRIDTSTLAGNGTANLLLEHLAGEPDGDFGVNVVTGCIVYSGGVGIECRRALTVNIANCVVNQTRGPAYLLTDKSNSVLLTGCRSFQIEDDAVRVVGSHELTITGNIFCWHAGHGIAVTDSNWGTISGNEIIDSGNVNPGTPDLTTRFDELPEPPRPHHGILLRGSAGYNLTGNTIFNWGVVPKLATGIQEDVNSRDNIITGNNVNYYETAPVEAHGRGTVHTNNVGRPDAPHQDQPIAPTGTFIQSFVPDVAEAEIRRML